MNTISLEWLKSNIRINFGNSSTIKDFFHPPWEGEAPLTLEWLQSLKPINYETLLMAVASITRNPDPRFHTDQWKALFSNIDAALLEHSKSAMTWAYGPEPPVPVPRRQDLNTSNQTLFTQTAQPLLDALHNL